MRYQINLSSAPFSNRIPFWIAIVTGFGVAALIGVSIVGTWLNVRAENTTLESQVGLQSRLVDQLKARRPLAAVVNVSAEQAATLQSAQEMVERKAFSWSLLLSKIEPVIPHQVRVTNISISAKSNTPDSQKASDWQNHIARLTLEVVAKKYPDVIELIKAMEKTGLFSVSPIQQRQMETGDLLFTLAVDYRIPQTAPAIYVAQDTSKEDSR